MALSTRHRSSIFQTLSPILGEEEAEAMLSQFPARDLDEPVTKEFVRAELADTRAELRAELADTRAELRAEIADTRAELRAEIADVRSEIADLRTEVSDLRGEVRSEIGLVRAEIAQLEARINDRFREQTMWMAGTMAVGMGLAAGIGTLLG